MQSFQGGNAVSPQRVTDGEQRRRFAIDRQKYRRRAFRCLGFKLSINICRSDVLLMQKRLIPQQQCVPFGFATYAQTPQGTERGNLW